MRTITVFDAGSRRDLAVSDSATAGAVAVRLGLGQSDLATVEGAPIDAGSGLGPAEVPGSILLARAGQAMPARSAGPVGAVGPAARVPAPIWLAPLVAAGLGVAGVVVPLGCHRALLPTAARLTLVVALAGLTVVLASRPHLSQRVWAGIVWPGLAGLAAAGLVPPQSAWAWSMAVPTGFNVGLVAAVGLWIRRRTRLTQVAIVLWGTGAALAAVAGLAGWTVSNLTPFVLAIGAMAVYQLPKLSVGVPDAELVDTPLLAVMAINRHLPEMDSPHRVLPRWVGRIAGDAEGVSDLVALAYSVAAVALVAASAGHLDPTTLGGAGFIANAAGAAVILWLSPSHAPRGLLRVVPRLAGAVVVLVVVVGGCDPASAARVPLATAVAAVALGLAGWRALDGQGRRPLVERASQALRQLAAVVALPAACVASGLFTWVWEVAS